MIRITHDTGGEASSRNWEYRMEDPYPPNEVKDLTLMDAWHSYMDKCSRDSYQPHRAEGCQDRDGAARCRRRLLIARRPYVSCIRHEPH